MKSYMRILVSSFIALLSCSMFTYADESSKEKNTGIQDWMFSSSLSESDVKSYLGEPDKDSGHADKYWEDYEIAGKKGTLICEFNKDTLFSVFWYYYEDDYHEIIEKLKEIYIPNVEMYDKHDTVHYIAREWETGDIDPEPDYVSEKEFVEEKQHHTFFTEFRDDHFCFQIQPDYCYEWFDENVLIDSTDSGQEEKENIKEDSNGFKLDKTEVPYLEAIKLYHMIADPASVSLSIDKILYSGKGSGFDLFKVWFNYDIVLVAAFNQNTHELKVLDTPENDNGYYDTFNLFFGADREHYKLDEDFIMDN